MNTCTPSEDKNKEWMLTMHTLTTRKSGSCTWESASNCCCIWACIPTSRYTGFTQSERTSSYVEVMHINMYPTGRHHDYCIMYLWLLRADLVVPWAIPRSSMDVQSWTHLALALASIWWVRTFKFGYPNMIQRLSTIFQHWTSQQDYRIRGSSNNIREKCLLKMSTVCLLEPHPLSKSL